MSTGGGIHLQLGGKGFRLPPVHRDIDTLVLYVFSNTDAEYENNMQFFLRHAVREDDGCEYVIVIQTGGTSKVKTTSSFCVSFFPACTCSPFCPMP